MNHVIKSIIGEAYGRSITSLKQAAGGWTSDAWIVSARQETYFLKMFDKQQYTSEHWIRNIDYYIPLTQWLYEHTEMRTQIILPVLTTDGSYKYETDLYVFLLYPYVEAVTPADSVLNISQQKQLAATVAQLHGYGQQVPKEMIRQEAFDVSFYVKFLTSVWKEVHHSLYLKAALQPYQKLQEGRP